MSGLPSMNWRSFTKKRKEYDLARGYWEEIAASTLKNIEVNIELAKLYEHVYKDYEKSLYYAETAFQEWRSRGRVLRKSCHTDTREEFMRRIDRLKQKIGKSYTQDRTLF